MRVRGIGIVAVAMTGAMLGRAAAMPQQPATPPPTAQAPAPQAQTQPLQLKPHLLVQHLPDAQNCAAPDWIVPGMRITYFTSVAQVNDAAGGVGLTPDADGNIVDDKGNRYREGTPVSLGVGGSGWDFVDIVAVEPGVVVIAMSQFSNTNGLQGPVRPMASATFFVHPSGCDFFLHPRLLAQLPQSSSNGVSLLRGTMQHRGSNYNIVRTTVEIPNSRQSSVYDLVSGVQLTHNESAQHDNGVAFKQSGNTYEPQRNTGRSLANNQFIEARMIKPPWQTMQMPAWARTVKRLKYQGQRIDSGTPEMGLGRLVTNMTFELETMYVGQTFTAYRTKSVHQMEGMPALEPMTGVLASGPANLAGVWMDPAALAQLKTGQLIDTEANAGVKFGCEFAGQGQDGRRIVVLAFGNELYKSTSTYDATDGKLLAFARIERSPSTGGTITSQMNLVGME